MNPEQPGQGVRYLYHANRGSEYKGQRTNNSTESVRHPKKIVFRDPTYSNGKFIDYQ